MSETTETMTTSPAELESGLMVRLQALLHHKEMQRFLKFAVVGAIGYVVDFGTFNGLLLLGWLAAVTLALPLGLTMTETGLAGAVSFTMAVISNFIWNRYWTYPDSRSKPILRQFLTFYGINVAGMVIRIPILELLSGPLGRLAGSALPGLTEATAIWAGKNAALIVAVVVVMFWNFFVNRYWTYNDVD